MEVAAVSMVFVLEDCPDATRARQHLEAAGDLAVCAVTDVETAAKLLAARPVDCVVVHLRGDESALAWIPGAQARPAVVVVGELDDEHAASHAIGLGADDYLVASRTSPGNVVTAVRHAIERRSAHQRLGARDLQFAWAVDALHEGVAIHDRTGRVLYFNEAARRLLGYRPRTVDELLEEPPHLLVRSDGTPLPPREHPSREAFESGRAIRGSVIGVIQPDDSVRWLSVNAIAVPSAGAPTDIRVVTTLADITEQRRATEALAQLTLLDPLTKLPNRALLCDRIGQALVRSQALGNAIVALVAVNVDAFNSVNDSYGFALGDDLLCSVGHRLESVSGGMTVARIGGDTFGVLLENCHAVEEVLDVAHRLANAASGDLLVHQKRIYLTSSAGVATAGAVASAESLLRNADLALHRAKSAGGGHTVLFEDRDLAALRDRLELEHDLRRAVELDQIEVAYQPVVQVGDGRCVGCEALARWVHPTRGPVPPDTFIEAATSIGTIQALTRRIVDHVCDQLAEWRRSGAVPPDFRVGINLSATDLADARIVGVLAEAIERSAIDPGCLNLEVTETALVRDTDTALKTLLALRRMGAHVSLDDFGTGYSSLAYLEKFPIDAIKIDKQFVAGLSRDPGATALVRAIVALARDLGLVTTAEGVENSAQLDALRQLGCSLSQGYLFSKPLPPLEFSEFLAERQGALPSKPRCPTPVDPLSLSVRSREVGWAVLDSLPISAAVIDADGTIVATNVAWQRFALDNGGDAGRCGVGTNYLSVCASSRGEGAEIAELAGRGIRAVLGGSRDAFSLEYPCNSPTEERQFLLVASPLAGHVGMAVVAHLDITTRHLAQRALAESQRRFESLLEQVPLGIYRLDASGRIVDVNPAFCRIIDRPSEELYGQPLDALFDRAVEAPGPSLPHLPAADRARSQQHVLYRSDGAARIVRVTGVHVLDGSGSGASRVAVVEDVTDRLRLEGDLRRAQELESLGRLAAGIAHEINTPTQFIADNLTFLSDSWPAVQAALASGGRPDGEMPTAPRADDATDLRFILDEVPAAITQSLEGVERVARIVRAMKAFGHPDREDPEPVDLNEVVANTVTVARNETKYVAELDLSLGELPTVTCYPGAVGQVLLNLIVNAAHAVTQTNQPGERGQIAVATGTSTGFATITVSDSGPGIADDVLPHIFEPFFTTKPIGQGTGQGLALAWSTVVDRHHGRIDVDTSTSGTQFTLWLPLVPPTARNGAAKATIA
ncbi:MAG: EAL domain-containing protein [Actinomycetota bacterium]|nr:EAL domain-containing protein [Actinomycetota bacterium]